MPIDEVLWLLMVERLVHLNFADLILVLYMEFAYVIQLAFELLQAFEIPHFSIILYSLGSSDKHLRCIARRVDLPTKVLVTLVGLIPEVH